MGNKTGLILVAVGAFFALSGGAVAGPASEVADREIAACPKGTVEGPDGVCAHMKTGRMGFDLALPEDNADDQTPTANNARSLKDAGTSGFSLRVRFAAGSEALSDREKASAGALAELLNQPENASVRILVAGNSDAAGSAASNMELSKRRAEAVKAFLVAQGVDAGRIDTVGYGSTRLGKRIVVANRIE
jgi:outer membrane protein OmpA-like peptidoglycan-associated protein